MPTNTTSYSSTRIAVTVFDPIRALPECPVKRTLSWDQTSRANL